MLVYQEISQQVKEWNSKMFGQGVIRAGEGTIEQLELVKIFNATSSFD